jgi:lysozyme family protein
MSPDPKEFDGIKNWTVEQMLFGFEKYNGFGYRPHNIMSPYVWNYSQFYTRGGFPCDRCWSDSYVSKQAGLAVIIKALKQVDPNGVILTYEV